MLRAVNGILWLASYPKSGNTWLRAFLHNLMRNPPTPFDINRMAELTAGDSQAEWFRRLDPRSPYELSRADLARLRPCAHALIAENATDTVMVKTHNALVEVAGAPMITQSLTAGAIYVVRNPLDVVVSYAHHLGQPVDNAITLMETRGFETPASSDQVPEHHGDWSTHVESWTARAHPQLHVVRYEDLSRRPGPTFRAIAAFLGLKPPRERIERAVRHSSFRALRAQEDRSGFIERTPMQDQFFRAGKVDGWRSVLEDVQVHRVVERHHVQMERFGYLPAGYESGDAGEFLKGVEASR